MIFSVKKFKIVFETISELKISVEPSPCNNMVIFCDFKNSMFKNIIKVLSGFLLILLFYNATIAATGSIEGLVFDKKTGETLVGATVVLEGTTTGAVTDFDGHFIIAGIKPGSYNVKVSYISYNPMVFDNVVVVAAKAAGEAIFTEADTLDELHSQVRDAVRCHFDEAAAPKLIRLHFVRDEVLAT